ncbi:nucleotidyltransferase domain-containing protein [[Clostridium] innocuum]
MLEQIKDKVIVTGSYEFGTQTELSDIDLYVKKVPDELVDLEAAFV